MQHTTQTFKHTFVIDCSCFAVAVNVVSSCYQEQLRRQADALFTRSVYATLSRTALSIAFAVAVGPRAKCIVAFAVGFAPAAAAVTVNLATAD